MIIRLVIYLIIFSTCINTNISAQIIQTKISKKYQKMLNSAVVHIGQAKYKIAAEELKEIIAFYPYYIRSYLVLADMYSTMKIYDLSIQQYKKVMDIDHKNKHIYYLPVAIGFAGIGQFDSALNYLKSYKEKMNPKFVNPKRVNGLEKNFLFALKYRRRNNIQLKNYNFKVYNMGDSINSELPEYFPTLNFKNDKIIFTRRIWGMSADINDKSITEKEKQLAKIQQHSMSKIENEDFFESHFINGRWTKAKPLKGSINSISNEGGSNLSFDNQYLYFSGCNFEDSKGSCDIYVSELNDGQWSESKNFSDDINSEFWESQPSISPDGKTLFFASRRPGGFGGSDIYVSHKIRKNKWSEPINLGPTFNTPGDEISPFIHSDNRTLYFASDMLEGYGKLDLFVAKKIGENRWTKPKNLGYPINSIENESNIIISSNGKTALFSSDKGNSKGKLDIFQFDIRKDLRPQSTFLVRKRIMNNNNIPVKLARVRVYDIQDSLLLLEPEVDNEGYFEIAATQNKLYLLDINGKNIFYQLDTLDTYKPFKAISKDTIISTKKIVVGEKVSIRNIHFASDSFSLTKASLPILNKLVDMMDFNSSIKVKITGHTDNTGGEEHNLKLSQKRALAVYKYLINNHIHSDRLVWEGKGQSEPIGNNDNEAGKYLNRRIEIEILDI